VTFWGLVMSEDRHRPLAPLMQQAWGNKLRCRRSGGEVVASWFSCPGSHAGQRISWRRGYLGLFPYSRLLILDDLPLDASASREQVPAFGEVRSFALVAERGLQQSAVHLRRSRMSRWPPAKSITLFSVDDMLQVAYSTSKLLTACADGSVPSG
jgi:hypothetical protein